MKNGWKIDQALEPDRFPNFRLKYYPVPLISQNAKGVGLSYDPRHSAEPKMKK